MLALLAFGCVESASLVCADGTVCPSTYVCVPSGGCRSPAELVACVDLVDGDVCTIGAARGTCFDGLCELAFCGNGTVEAGESCDDGNQLGGDGCNGTCSSTEICGNGIIELAEQCDCGDPAQPGGGLCDGTYNGEKVCNTICGLRRCGDGIVDPGEVCDDGNLIPGDACSFDCMSTNTCGNGIIDYFAGEQCDDSNARSLDSCSGTCRDETFGWQQLGRAMPSTRSRVAMAYDTARQRLVMFGGFNSLALGDTWEHDGTIWFQRVLTRQPPARERHVMAYDVKRSRVVLFGGYDGSDRGDTWEFDGDTWREILPATRPPSRRDAMVAYDPVRERVVVFGGRAGGTALNDTWEFDGANWTPRVVTNAPSGRYAGLMAFDPQRNTLVLFSGLMDDFSATNDTWELTGSTWINRILTDPPNASPRGGLVYDPLNQRIVLVGGPSGQTWGYDGASWSFLTASGPARTGFAFAYSLARRRVVIFGGVSNVHLNDMWELDNVTWSERTQGATPARRTNFAIVHDLARGKTVLFGGLVTITVTTPYNDVWELDDASWTQRTFTGFVPSPRSHMVMVYDERRRRSVMFGGDVEQGMINETWEYDGTSWFEIDPATRPSPRDGHAMAYDIARGRVVMFGGSDLGDTWTYDGTTWTELAPDNVPPARSDHMMAYDERNDRIVLFGGSSSGGQILHNDTWVFDGTDWIDVTPSTSPAPRTAASFYWDPVRQRIVLYGGYDSTGSQAFVDLWEFDGSTWTQRVIGVGPSLTNTAATVYQPHRQRALMFMLASGNQPQTWQLGFSPEGETCTSGYDHDLDGKVGCADDDCWGVCTPTCPPGVAASTCLALPACGDGTCSAVESCRTCSTDCPVGGAACPLACGDFFCDSVSESASSCPGDCM